MKAKSSRPTCRSVRPFANLSDQEHYHTAWEKVGLNAVVMLAVTFLCAKFYEFGAWPPFEGHFLYYTCAGGIILGRFWWKQVFGYVFGFFVCCVCRRLKRAKSASLLAVQNGVGCGYCAELAELIRQEHVVRTGSPHPFEQDGRKLVRPPSRTVLPHVSFSGSNRP